MPARQRIDNQMTRVSPAQQSYAIIYRLNNFQKRVSMHAQHTLLQTYLLPQRARLAALAGLMLVNLLAQLALPRLVQIFIDGALNNMPLSSLLGLGGVHVALALLTNITHIGWSYVSQNIGLIATNRIRADLTLHCLKLDMGFHNAHTPGELIERIDGDVSQLANVLSGFFVKIALNGLLLLGVAVLLMIIDVRIGLLVLLGILLAITAVRLLNRKQVQLSDTERQANAELIGFVEERLSGTEDIRANGATSYVMRRHADLSRAVFRTSLMSALIGVLSWRSMVSAINLGGFAGLIIGAFGYVDGAWSLGTLYAIYAYTAMIQHPAEQLTRELGNFQIALASIARVQALFNKSSIVTPPAEQSTPLPAGALGIALDTVTFAYPGDDTVLHDVTFTLQAGETLGIIGRTGSGKTTLSRLLLRLYDPTAGTVRCGQVDLRTVAADDLANRVAVVTQDVQLFSASVRDNLTLFNPNIDDTRVLAALDAVGLREAILALPQGLDTRLQSGAAGFSAGEAQLLAFARTFLRAPGLVILDEASSRLDPDTERKLDVAVDRLLTGRTGVIIAHRLRTLDRVDKILLLEQGHIREFGVRTQLLSDPQSRFYQLLNADHADIDAALV